jgi:hypothetical protein
MQNFECYRDRAEGINLLAGELSIAYWRNAHSLLKTTTLVDDARSPQGLLSPSYPSRLEAFQYVAASRELLKGGCIESIFSDKVKDECIS